MPFRRQEHAESSLGGAGFLGLFHAAVMDGVGRYWGKYEDDAYCTRPMSRANLIRDFVVDELKRRFHRAPKVKIIDENQTTFFCIGNEWLVVVHKLHDDFTVSVNQNQISLGLNENEIQYALPLPDEATVLQLGYIESLADRLNPQVFLVCPDGTSPAWVIELKPSAHPEPKEIGPAPPSPEPKRVQVRAPKDRESENKQ